MLKGTPKINVKQMNKEFVINVIYYMAELIRDEKGIMIGSLSDPIFAIRTAKMNSLRYSFGKLLFQDTAQTKNVSS